MRSAPGMCWPLIGSNSHCRVPAYTTSAKKTDKRQRGEGAEREGGHEQQVERGGHRARAGQHGELAHQRLRAREHRQQQDQRGQEQIPDHRTEGRVAERDAFAQGGHRQCHAQQQQGDGGGCRQATHEHREGIRLQSVGPGHQTDRQGTAAQHECLCPPPGGGQRVAGSRRPARRRTPARWPRRSSARPAGARVAASTGAACPRH